MEDTNLPTAELPGSDPGLLRLEQLKRKHGRLTIVTVERHSDQDSDVEEIEFVFKQPDRKLMSAAAKMGKEDPMKSADVIIQNCLVSGPAEELEDLRTWLTVSEQVQTMMAPYGTRLKNF